MRRNMTALFIGYFLLFFVSCLILLEISKNAIAEITTRQPENSVLLKIGPFSIMNEFIERPPILNSEFVPQPEDKKMIDFSQPFVSDKQLECLTQNIYFEARGEGALGMQAVAYVTLNRVHSGRYPTSVCGVVYQGDRDVNGNRIPSKCQFSWTCDGTVKKIRQPWLWDDAQKVAKNVMLTYSKDKDPTYGSLFYHNTAVNSPFRNMSVIKTTMIGNHIFYRKKNI